jgi:hypothetical protein
MVKNVFHKPPEENIQRRKVWRTWGPENAPLPLLFLFNDQETRCPERHEHDRSEVVHRRTGNLFPQGHDAKKCSPS